jgi:CBS domain containing-hemolysin-like protein
MSLELSLLLAAVTLLGNAFFVGAEFALVSVRRTNIELKVLAGSRLAKITLGGMEEVSLMLAGAQLGVTLCSLIFGAVGEPLVAHALEGPFHQLGMPEVLLEPISFIIALSLMVYLHVVIGEMVPKNLSLAASTKAALLLVPPLYFGVKITRPVIVALNAVANGTVRLLGITPRREIRSSFDRDEVAGFVKESHREGLLSKDEEQLLSGTLDLEERTITRIVLPFDSIITTSLRPTPGEIDRLCQQTGYSRFPVPDAKGALRGYIHLKDMLYITDAQHDKPLPAKYIRPLTSVKQSTSLRDTLAMMQQTGSHIAQVKGQKGLPVGIVMLEDVLEELVGPIRDDTQTNTPA